MDVNTLSAEYRPVYTELLRKAGVEQLEVLTGAVCVYSSHLPSHSDVHVSCLTGERVQVSISTLMHYQGTFFNPFDSGYQ